jgi:hypothetical protein
MASVMLRNRFAFGVRVARLQDQGGLRLDIAKDAGKDRTEMLGPLRLPGEQGCGLRLRVG